VEGQRYDGVLEPGHVHTAGLGNIPYSNLTPEKKINNNKKGKIYILKKNAQEKTRVCNVCM
jgi:hypothetical protein